MEAGGIVLIVVIALVLVVVVWAIATYNGLVRLRNLVQEAWRQIDVELHRRYDLIPNLLETVKGYASHERAVFDEVTRARAAAANPGAGPAEQARQENMLSQALGRLFAVAEAYPQLRASENFTSLQNELTGTEDRIAAGRRYYNANVRTLNTRVETFPPNIIARMFGFRRAEYFEANEPAVRQAPRVSFQDTSGSTGAYGPPPAAAPSPADRGSGGWGGEPGGFGPGQGGGQPGYPGGPGAGQAGYPSGPPAGGYQPRD
jgi:LemA protein